MNQYDIFTSYISWGNGGKSRPVLVYALSDKLARVYPITTQYENKSEAVRAKYFKIRDWLQSGLDKQSYVDTGTRLTQPLSMFDNAAPIGILTESDKKRFIEFLK